MYVYIKCGINNYTLKVFIYLYYTVPWLPIYQAFSPTRLNNSVTDMNECEKGVRMCIRLKSWLRLVKYAPHNEQCQHPNIPLLHMFELAAKVTITYND